MKIKRIRLKKAKNTRDLGGYINKYGKAIRKNMLIRSGQLSAITDRDIDVLVNGHNLKTVIDLRIENEISEKPDRAIGGVNYVKVPLLDKAYLGITRDEYSLKSWFNLFSDKSVRPEDVFYGMYEMLLFGERSRRLIPEIFSHMLECDGAVLWHCSAGKDRVGIITMLLLLALDFDREVIIKDYLATNRFSRKEILKTLIFAPFVIKSRWERRCLAVLMTVKREYPERLFAEIDKRYKDIFEFFEDTYGINKATILALREKFLAE